MKKLLCVIASVWLILAVNDTFAVRVTSLYKALVPVASQSDKDKDLAIPQGLEQVLTKLTGNNQTINNPAIKSHLSTAEGLVQQFSYTSPQPAIPGKPFLMQIDFDAEGVNKLLRDASIPIWGQNRPLILVWAAYERPNHPAEFISNDTGVDVLTALKQDADQRGLPMIFPMMDMADISQVTVADVTSMAVPTLTTVSKRYNSDAVLILKISEDVAGFVVQAKLAMGNDQWDWKSSNKTVASALSTITDNIVNTLIKRYAVVMTNAPPVKIILKVTGITQSNDLDLLMAYIQHLTPVVDATPTLVSGNDVTLSISLRGTEQAFLQVLALGQKLTPVPNTTGQDNNVVYQWNH